MRSDTVKTGGFRWIICFLIFLATVINYLDRQVIGILKPLLTCDLGIGEAEYGYIVTSFQVAYAAGMLAAGRIIDRIGTKIVNAVVLFMHIPLFDNDRYSMKFAYQRA